MKSAARRIFRYHQETKHHFRRYARSSGFLDWRNQPDPFRVYAGAERHPLPLLGDDPDADHMAMYRREANPAQPGTAMVGGVFELSMGLSAWKTAPIAPAPSFSISRYCPSRSRSRE